jgi:hypothetical protein
MRPLVRVRNATPWDPAFLERSRLLSPLCAAARRLGPHADFPPIEALARVFAADAPVRFVPHVPRGRRRGALDPGALYDARITRAAEVPTRARCWHDVMNALVWGTYPASKRALHARQHAAISARLDPDARTLPPTRTPELDALALMDEGGVVVLADRPEEMRATLRAGANAVAEAMSKGRASLVVFGHAVFESLVLGVEPAAVAAFVIPRVAGADVLRHVDAELSRALGDVALFRAPSELCRIDLARAEAHLPTQMFPGLATS